MAISKARILPILSAIMTLLVASVRSRCLSLVTRSVAFTPCITSSRGQTRFAANQGYPVVATTRSLRKPSSSLSASSVPLQKGDSVRVTINGDALQGVVKEVRGSGWYSVQVPSTDGPTVMKVRSKQLSLLSVGEHTEEQSASDEQQQETMSITSDAPEIPPPTIVDMDAAIQSMDKDPIQNKRDRLYLQQCAHHASFSKWILFTDLHCAPSSLDTCLQVLATVHREALARDAGVLFLGDWWHHRATIRVDVLNAVLEALRSWQVPMVLIPGNHDQVTLGGHNHGLTPLEHAYRVEYQDEHEMMQSVPGPLVFSHPTKFANALFVPHIRDVTIMESVIRSKAALESSALFVHADVTGAFMNDLIVSQGGVPPGCFPASKPIFSGHFHKPHQVTSKNVCIEYIGSPYETSLAEAGQPKSLVVLDASQGWSLVERIPLHIGRRHFRVNSLNELLSLGTVDNESASAEGAVRSGDRVVVTVGKEELEDMRRSAPSGEPSTFDKHVKTLRQVGAIVEVRETPAQVLGPLGMGEAVGSTLEEMTPQSTLTAFLTEEVRRESMKNSTAEELLKVGLLLLEDLEIEEEMNEGVNPLGNGTDLILESVTLQGFGPFKDKVTYPLRDRGLVLVRGTNKDGGADSNGSGKSSLAMATLWALTGTLDPRPLQDAKVADVVNDDSKSARVSVRGFLNDKPFAITRTKTSSRGSLTFHLDGDDLTTQSIKDTQAIMDENLGVGPQILARTMFHGQHAINGLLEATDAKLKEELSLIVPLSLWQQGATMARARSREASKKASEFGGMVSLRSSDFEDLLKRRDTAKEVASVKLAAFKEVETQMKEELRASRESAGSQEVDIQIFQDSLETASNSIEKLELQLRDLLEQRDSDLARLQARIDKATADLDELRDIFQSRQRDHDIALLTRDTMNSNLKQIEKKWNIKVSSDGVFDVVPPQICPTCQQPISSTGEGHSHEDLRHVMVEEANAVVQSLVTSDDAVQKTASTMNDAAKDLSAKEKLLKESRRELEEARSSWDIKVKRAEQDIEKSRHEQIALSVKVSDAAKALQQEAAMRNKESTLADLQKVADSASSAYSDLCKVVDEAEINLQELRTREEQQRSLSVTMINLAEVFGQRGVQTFVLQNAIEALQSVSQDYLSELSDGSQRIELSLDTGDRISRRALIRGPDGGFVERPLSSLSGGQWRRCSLALSLGFADLIARRGRLKTSLCVLDEPLTHLDRSGRSRVGNLLRGLLRRGEGNDTISPNGISVTTILLILQDLAAEELEESFDHIDEVIRKGGISSVLIDERT